MKDARLKLRTKKGLYALAESRQIYLPSIHSKIISKEYLLHILKSNLFFVYGKYIPHSYLKDTAIT